MQTATVEPPHDLAPPEALKRQGSGRCNEELCYAVPENEVGHVETYVTELMTDGYELPDVRRFLARGQWQQPEKGKW